MKDIEYLINELRCDINYCKVSGENDSEIINAYETLDKLKEQVKNCSIPVVSNCSQGCEWKSDTFDNIGMALTEYCEECGVKRDCC